MCGIAGLVGETDRGIAKSTVGKMLSTLIRRGPDGTGLEVWPSAVLGHRRLAVFDLSDAGRQPMLSPDTEIGVVFNGSIYNFLDLRRDLMIYGYEFKSHCDTEVLIHGYSQWGMDGLVARLQGMFAFGLWDNHRRKLFLVRDRLGVKPLLYSVRDRRLAFASTSRALREAGFADEISEQALVEYLEFGFVTDEHTIYRGMVKVPAATILEWSEGHCSQREYWSPPSVTTSGAPTFAEAVEETERLLLAAIEKRLYADVPVGALLSGGIDSGLLCWGISKLGGRITAFTVGLPGDPWDETADAQAIATTLEIDHQVLELIPEEIPDVSALVSAYGEPFACASALGMLSVSRAVRSSATVLLTGDGGDDVFLGYPEHRNFWLAEKLSRLLPSATGPFWNSARQLFPNAGLFRRVKSFLDYTTGGLGAAVCVRDGLPTYWQHGLLGERLIHANLPQRNIPWSQKSAKRLLSDFLAYDRHTRFTGEYLTKVDGATMYHALEARSPFLDQDLWSFASTLPFDLRLKAGRSKAVLRELARRHLGNRVAYGRKRGFGVPVQRWLAGRWRDAVTETLHGSILNREGWICEDVALALLEQAATKGWIPHQLWYIFVLESWLRYEQEGCVSV